MDDVTKYQKIIQRVLRDLGVQTQDREDAMQDCYVRLLERTPEINKAASTDEANGVVYNLCRQMIIDQWRQKQIIKTVSLDDPAHIHKALRIQKDLGRKVSDESLYEALQSLVFDDYVVIYNLYVEGKTETETGRLIGMTRDQVSRRKLKGIAALRKYFEDKI